MIIKRFLGSYIFYALSAFGISLAITADIGISSYNTMNLSLANATHIKIGTVISLFNVSFLLAYMFLTNYRFKYKYFIQAFSIFMFGSLINFFTYNVLNVIPELNYIARVAMVSGGTIISGLSIGMIIYYDLITFPLESLCQRISEISKIPFIKLRYSVDIVAIIVSLSISFAYGLAIYVREGTLISTIIFSYSINFSRKLAEKYFDDPHM